MRLSKALVWACLVAAGCGSGGGQRAVLGAISFETATVPAAGAGQLYNVEVRFAAAGGAALPERFQVTKGALPPGVQLVADRADLNLDGLPDADGPFTGHARLLGYPRAVGSYAFTLKAVSTGAGTNPAQPDLSASRDFQINVSEGAVAILTPTAAEGTTDPAVPAFPEAIPFVNPANPSAFFSFAWEVAGGSGTRISTAYLPRELELSVFDADVVADAAKIDYDSEEAGDLFDADFSDGGLFVLQAGNGKVQLGGFQSPRGVVGTITRYAGGAGLNPLWFQRSPALGGPPQNSRRFLGDPSGAAGDTTLGTPQPVRFTDYFDDRYEGTDPSASPRRKYPFAVEEYHNAFFVPYTAGVDLTPLKFRAIVESIDTRGSIANRNDDVIARKAYVIQVQIPPLAIDTVVLPSGRAGLDYTQFVNGSGGVPPLKYELEYVDAVLDSKATLNGPGDLTKADFGIEMSQATGQFFGVPKASGSVELTVRVYADVMNPTQDGAVAVPTGGVGEIDGTHPITGRTGRHKTFQIGFATPLPLLVGNKVLAPGVDGFPYPGDRLVGAGGVPLVVPNPVGFVGTYPSATAVRTYAWSASYIRDASHGAAAGTVDPTRALPNALVLDGNAQSPDNGVISGTPYDRGFHPVTVTVSDFYLGPATAPNPASSSTGQATIGLSVSPDRAVYLRGMQTSEGSGGEPTGLLDATAQMGEPRMVPMFQSAALVSGSTGQSAAIVSTIPPTVDILPVMLTNGGSDANVDKTIPSVAGFWPAESNKEYRWAYYFYGVNEEGWKHLQQEMTWLQTPSSSRRVFLWGDTKVKQFSPGDTTTNLGRRYQAYNANGKRGVMVLDPLTGEFWFPAILSNSAAGQDGTQFGAEYVMGDSGTNPTSANYGYIYTGYEEYYNYAAYTAGTREPRLIGLGSYLEATDNSTAGKRSNGRTAVSVAMSADGKWAATTLPGASTPRLLLWRTDKQPITGMGGKSFIRLLTGKDADGSDLQDSAAVINLGGQVASGVTLSSNQQVLLPDALMFVRDGLLFLMEGQLDRVFGVSLVDGHLSSVSVNSRTQLISGMGTGPSSVASNGMYVPEKGYLRGVKVDQNFCTQFSFAGNAPAAGTTGPDKVAFLAGTAYSLYSFANYNSTYTNLSADSPRKGYAYGANRAKSLLFLETQTGGSGLELSTSTVKDLSGNHSSVYGDFCPPGRFGEDVDFLAVSPDGDYVACVRDDTSNGTLVSSTPYSLNPTFSTATLSSTTTYYICTDDLVLVSTKGVDMDSGKSGVQPVLFLGSGTASASFSGTPAADAASYCSAAAWLNAYGRRIAGVSFAPDSRTLFLKYQGDNQYYCKYFGSAYQYGVNGDPWFGQPYQGMSAQLSLRFHFRTSSDGPIDYKSSSDAQNFLKNNLEGLTGVGSIGDTTAPYTNASPYQSGGADQQFWATFKSADGRFMYYVSDPPNGRNFLVGFNVTGTTVNGHAPFEPFSPHASTIGFEQFDNPSWNYENRFAAMPAGVVNPVNGRDAAGIVFIIGSDSSAGATSATDLEVYAFDANIGGSLIALTSTVTPGTANAINHLYASADGNLLVGQRCQTTANGGPNRGLLNSTNDLFVVTNVHDVLAGGTPNAFVLSGDASHGSAVAFVGEGTSAGPQALIYSSAAKDTTNTTWSKRTLKISVLAPGATPDVIDGTQSHYAVLAGGRRLDDNPGNSN